ETLSLRRSDILINLPTGEAQHIRILRHVPLIVPGDRLMNRLLEIPGRVPAEQRAGFFNGKRQQRSLVQTVRVGRVRRLAWPKAQDLFHQPAHRLSRRRFWTEVESARQPRDFWFPSEPRRQP